MFRPKPFKDAEKNPEAPKLDSRRLLGLASGFLWFYRRIFIGLILLAGVSILVYRVTTIPKEPDDVGASVAERPQRSVVPKIPTANIDFDAAKQPPPTTESDGENSFAGNLLGSETDGALATDSEAAINDPSDIVSPDDSLPEDATVDELIEESLNLRDTWGRATPSVGLLMCTLRAKISRRLMEMDLTEAQRQFAETSYVESISLVDSLNVASKMNMEGTRAALLEVDETYSDHPDPTVRAKANLAMVLAPMYECIASKNPDLINTVQNEFDNRFKKIFEDPFAVSRLAEMTLALSQKPELDTASLPFVESFLQRMKDSELPSLVTIGEQLRDRILFDKFELKSLPNRLDEPGMRDTVQEFFEILASNPDSRAPVYQTAVTTIVAYQLMGQSEDAIALVNWLEQISEQITNDEKKQAVLVAIEKIRKKHGFPEG